MAEYFSMPEHVPDFVRRHNLLQRGFVPDTCDGRTFYNHFSMQRNGTLRHLIVTELGLDFLVVEYWEEGPGMVINERRRGRYRYCMPAEPDQVKEKAVTEAEMDLEKEVLRNQKRLGEDAARILDIVYRFPVRAEATSSRPSA